MFVNLRKDSMNVEEDEDLSWNINNVGKNCNGIILRNMLIKWKENFYKKEFIFEINELFW